ncbi:Mrp4 [Kluyveromyces lactis]|nr:Mrp4 [Kluyveromyces lactis]
MSVRYCTKNLVGRAPFALRSGAVRLQSSSSKATSSDESNVIKGENGEEAQSVDVAAARQSEFNGSISQLLHQAMKTPIEELGDLETKLKSPLTEKEQQLDEKLTEFLRKYSKYNKVLDLPEDTNKFDFSSKVLSQPLHTREFPYLSHTSKEKPYSEQELYVRQLKHAAHTSKLGANIQDVYFPHKDVFNPPSLQQVSIEKLMAAGVHLGQSTALWRASTQPYIYGEYKGIHIIDLNRTLSHLKRAAQVVEGVAENGGLILFLGTREGQKRTLIKAAERVNGYYVASKWVPGTLTNPTEISSSWERHEVDYFGNPTGRELTLNESMSIIKPDLLVVLNPTENRNALKEAMKARVPTIGIIDTDSEPSLVTYPIPGNDDSLRSVSLLTSILAKAGERGVQTRLNRATV